MKMWFNTHQNKFSKWNSVHCTVKTHTHWMNLLNSRQHVVKTMTLNNDIVEMKFPLRYPKDIDNTFHTAMVGLVIYLGRS